MNSRPTDDIPIGADVKTANLLSFITLAAIATAVGATPGNTDEARAEVAQHHAATARAASLRPVETRAPDPVRVTDTDTARRAAGQITAAQAHDRHLREVLKAGAGTRPAPIPVSDTDTARAAAAQELHQQSLRAEYGEFVRMQAAGTRTEPGVTR
jgi:hypothetical protein